MAHALSGRRFDADFLEWFLPQYLRGSGKKNLNEIAESSAEFLFNLFVEVWNTLGQTVKIPRGNRQHLQAPVVQRLDNAIHRINHYPADSVVCFVNTYPLDSDLSGG